VSENKEGSWKRVTFFGVGKEGRIKWVRERNRHYDTENPLALKIEYERMNWSANWTGN